MGALLKFVSGALSGAAGTLAAAALAALLSGSCVGYVVHRMDQATIVSMKLAYSRARLQAARRAADTQRVQDQTNLDAALAEARAQQRIVTRTRTVFKEVPTHVPRAQPCIPYGLVRLLDDAATGSDTTDAPAPAAESDDACTALSWRSFAREIADDYGAANANAEQLNALEKDVRALAAAANARTMKGGEK